MLLKKLSAFAFIAYLSGCAMYSPNHQPGQPIAWDKSGASEAELKKDKYECEKEAQLLSKGTGLTIMQRYYHALAACYDSRGYTVVKRAGSATDAVPSNAVTPPPVTDTPPVRPLSVPVTDKQTVSRVQVELKARGFYSGSSDGKLGRMTIDALKKFQAAQRLPTTGEIDKATLDALGIR